MRVEPTDRENKDEGRFARKCCITPGWLALTFLCMGTFLQGFVVNGVVNTTISPLQDRFKVRNGSAVWFRSGSGLVPVHFRSDSAGLVQRF